MKKVIISLVVLVIVGIGLYQIPIVRNIAFVIILNATEQTELSVEGNCLYMDGLINSKTPEQFKKVFAENPNIDTLVMKTVEGSVNDEANLEAAEWVSKKKLVFVLESESLIASGGTDFFLAGEKRIIKKGAKVGVHSWAGDSQVATDFPKGGRVHQPYIDYYMAVGWTKEKAEKFYYFTIEAAPADDIYWMTAKELKDYQITNVVEDDKSEGIVSYSL